MIVQRRVGRSSVVCVFSFFLNKDETRSRRALPLIARISRSELGKQKLLTETEEFLSARGLDLSSKGRKGERVSNR